VAALCGTKQRRWIFKKWLSIYKHPPESFPSRQANTEVVDDLVIPWVFSSYYHGSRELAFRILESGSGKQTIRLYFTEPDDAKPGERLFDVLIQDHAVLEQFDVVAATGGRYKPLIKTFKGVEVESVLRVTLKGQPVLCGIEATCEE
jgi:hypothetical protein